MSSLDQDTGQPDRPRGLLLAFCLCWLVVAIALAFRAFNDRSALTAVKSSGFMVVAVLLWRRNQWALAANLAFGGLLMGHGLTDFFENGKWEGLISGALVLGSYWAFRDELESHTGSSPQN